MKARWDLLDENGNYAFSSTTDFFADLQHFFPEAAVARLDEIEGFHRTISSVFKAELRADRSKLEKNWLSMTRSSTNTNLSFRNWFKTPTSLRLF